MDTELEAIHFWIGAVWVAIVAVLVVDLLGWVIKKIKGLIGKQLDKWIKTKRGL